MGTKADNLLREALAGLRAEKIKIDHQIKGLEKLLGVKHKPTKRPKKKKTARKKKTTKRKVSKRKVAKKKARTKKKKGRTWTEAQKKAHSAKLRAAWAAKKKG